MRLFNQTKTIPWKEFFKIERDDMVTLQLIPDRTIDNRQNYKMIRALHEMYTRPIDRIRTGKWFLSYRPQTRFWYDILMTKDEIKFFFTVPAGWETYARQKVASCWPRASMEVVDRSALAIPSENITVSELAYKRHNIFALETNRAEDTQPLGSILQGSRDLLDDDLIRLSLCAEPINRLSWAEIAEEAHKQFNKGTTPQRSGLSARKALGSLGRSLEKTLLSFRATLLLILGHGDEERNSIVADMEKRELMLDGDIGRSTNAKKTEPTYKTRIRVASYSKNMERREIANRAVANAFVEVAGANELERIEVKGRTKIKIIYELNTHHLKPITILETDTNILSASEIGKLAQLPGPGLQDEYSEQLKIIKLRQSELPASIKAGGMRIGDQEYKDQKVAVYMPVKDHDELCLPRVVIGGMGTGKTKGFAGNWAVEAVINGFGSLTVDAAKKELGDEIEAYLPPEDVIRVDLSQVKIALDWPEVKYSERAKTRLANTILAFFAGEKDDGLMQTERYLRAAVQGMQTGRLNEIIRIFEDEVYRKRIIKDMRDGSPKNTLISFGKESEARQRQILAPIYNRIDVILGDEYLADCMESEESLDMVAVMSQRKAVVIDIPANYFDPIATNIIVNLLATKIDLAMRLRAEENQFPFFVIFDEPHQYLKSASLWKAAAVESRKWRLAYTWLFHSWEQIPRDLAEIIKSAGPHYHLYTSSQKTYKDLALEIAPFTIEEAINTPRHYAINIIRTGGEIVKPFMAHMLAPPSKRKVKDVG